MPEHALEISNMLNYLLELSNISEAELARKINIPRATINRLTTGRTPDPRASTLNAIAEFFDVTVDQLLGKQSLSQRAKLAMNNTTVPIIEWKSSCNWKNVIEKLKPNTSHEWVMIDEATDEAKFGIRVNGESMWPQFQTNTILIIAPHREPKNRDFVIAHLRDSDEIVFRQLIVDDKYKFLKAINNIFPTIRLDNNGEIIGVVVQTRNSY